MYNLKIGGKRVTNLRLSGETVAKIFTGAITNGTTRRSRPTTRARRCPARHDRPGGALRRLGLDRPVHDLDVQAVPAIWNAYCAKAGRATPCGITSYYPTVPAAGSSPSPARSASPATSPGANAGRDRLRRVLLRAEPGFPVAKVLNTAGYYAEPTAAERRGRAAQGADQQRTRARPHYLTQNLDGVYTNTDPRTYPLSSYTYMILPTKVDGSFNDGQGQDARRLRLLHPVRGPAAGRRRSATRRCRSTWCRPASTDPQDPRRRRRRTSTSRSATTRRSPPTARTCSPRTRRSRRRATRRPTSAHRHRRRSSHTDQGPGCRRPPSGGVAPRGRAAAAAPGVDAGGGATGWRPPRRWHDRPAERRPPAGPPGSRSIDPETGWRRPVAGPARRGGDGGAVVAAVPVLELAAPSAAARRRRSCCSSARPAAGSCVGPPLLSSPALRGRDHDELRSRRGRHPAVVARAMSVPLACSLGRRCSGLRGSRPAAEQQRPTTVTGSEVTVTRHGRFAELKVTVGQT